MLTMTLIMSRMCSGRDSESVCASLAHMFCSHAKWYLTSGDPSEKGNCRYIDHSGEPPAGNHQQRKIAIRPLRSSQSMAHINLALTSLVFLYIRAEREVPSILAKTLAHRRSQRLTTKVSRSISVRCGAVTQFLHILGRCAQSAVIFAAEA